MATAPAISPPPAHPGLPPGMILNRDLPSLAGAMPDAESDPAGASEVAAEAALIPFGGEDQGQEQLVLSAPLARMPVELNVAIPIPDFRVRNLLALVPGQLIESGWSPGKDVPLSSGDVQVAWTEFEVIESLLAVRVTRLG